MESKALLKSKTFWVNILSAAVLPFLPDNLKNPEYVGYFFGIVNVILRLVSKGKVELL